MPAGQERNPTITSNAYWDAVELYLWMSSFLIQFYDVFFYFKKKLSCKVWNLMGKCRLTKIEMWDSVVCLFWPLMYHFCSFFKSFSWQNFDFTVTLLDIILFHLVCSITQRLIRIWPYLYLFLFICICFFWLKMEMFSRIGFEYWEYEKCHLKIVLFVEEVYLIVFC